MSRNGQPVARTPLVADFPFPTTPGGPPGIEVTDPAGWSARLARLGVPASDSPVRPSFHLLVTVRHGALRCLVDLTECRIDPGHWLWVRPGQVLRILDLGAGPGAEAGPEAGAAADAVFVLFQASFLDPATVAAARLDRRAWRLPLLPAPAARPAVERTLELLEDEYRELRDLPLEVHVEVVRHLLAVLVLRLSHLPGGERRRTPGDETFRRFRQAVEADHPRTHRVEDYAARLGYSVRTLTRATLAATGHGAKAFIDDRLVLEAKRLLLHSDSTTATIADRLGFPATTVFTRFFHHRTGETPAAFRSRARITPPPGEG
ncbi:MULTISPECIES: AraC family transcriptional regulator [Kitasatospora]|uniref:Putative AraC family transcriptional regulator n=1 Tax=Kitasatospora setae (strain ATCC 33774 / DSM 43861 / JCM 3304 / KCC A-0304 / NBRC 14216 / KM-6054) TaxID=452652 RepID=E4N6Q3_KITSK|nr:MULTISPECIES: AraC family transcriptional regulator [Kitasatospora]BAJ26884.1 putative AraC family transcriptional regulator [Kitasatospora setae KM-6054]